MTLFLIILISVAGLVAFFGLGRGGRSALYGQANDGHYRLARRHRAGDAGSGRRAAGKTTPGAKGWYDRTETAATRPGIALITLSLQDQTPPSEVPEQFYQARKKLGDEAKNLPAGVSGPMMMTNSPMSPLPSLLLKARGEPPRQLVRDAEALRQQLLHVSG